MSFSACSLSSSLDSLKNLVTSHNMTIPYLSSYNSKLKIKRKKRKYSGINVWILCGYLARPLRAMLSLSK
jgi:hypothetical protein